MMKYIDTEKLKAEIERFSATEYEGNTLGEDVAKGALDYVLEEIIPSLQQEQPEVDLEKEIEEYCGDRNVRPVPDLMEQVARHFYELGLNARKEK